MDMRALLADYEQNHQSQVCRITHLIGIPLIVTSIPLLFLTWKRALTLFAVGWLLQFAGHAAEGKRPKFFEGAQYLLAGVVWWVQIVTAPLRKLGRP
jgi:uncharacterized membrane protein YGL010W